MYSRLVFILVFVITLLACSNKHGNVTALSTPEVTMDTKYKAMKNKDFELFKAVHINSDVQWIDIVRFNKLSDDYIEYRITKNPDTKEDRSVLVIEEQYKNGKSEMVFELRRVNGKWLISNFNAVESEPIDPKVVEDQSRKMIRGLDAK